MGKCREAEAKEKFERELQERAKSSIAAVQSIVDMSTHMAASLLEFRDAVTARLLAVDERRETATPNVARASSQDREPS
jgi:two-component sensor histidine kinase